MTSPSKNDKFNKQTADSGRVNYLRQFPRSFIGGYGKFKGDLTDDEILTRLHSWNCEWLKRPRIALSEMNATLTTNYPLLEKHGQRIIADDTTNYLREVLEPITNALARFDRQDRTNSDPPTEDDVIQMMRLLQEDAKFDSFIRDLFEASGAMFLIAVQCLGIQTLLWNPSVFADKLIESRQTADFKKDPCQDTMRDFLFDQLIPEHQRNQREQFRQSAEPLWTSPTKTNRSTSVPQRGRRGRQTATRGRSQSTSRSRTSNWSKSSTSPTSTWTPSTRQEEEESSEEEEDNIQEQHNEDSDEDSDTDEEEMSLSSAARQKHNRRPMIWEENSEEETQEEPPQKKRKTKSSSSASPTKKGSGGKERNQTSTTTKKTKTTPAKKIATKTPTVEKQVEKKQQKKSTPNKHIFFK